MRKTLVVAKSEFLTAIRSKGFIIGVMLMPILTGISIFVQKFSEKHADVEARYFVVLDQTGQMYDVLVAKAAEWNKGIDLMPDPPRSRFFPTRYSGDPHASDEDRVRLSEQIRKGDLFAFVELPESLLDSQPRPGEKIVYYSDKPTYEELRRWIAHIVNQEVLRHRLLAKNLSEAEFNHLSAEIDSEHRGLASKTATGEIKGAAQVNQAKTYWVPMILMFLLWLVVMSAVPQLLNSALEEKMTRVSEVLLGSVTPFQLMMGKLLAITGVSSVLATLYLTGGYIVAYNVGYADAVPWGILPYFVLFMLLAVFIFGSIFIAIGAACTEMKDAQGLMAPAMVILMLPIFVWIPVLKHPDSTLSIVASLFPPATPMLMLLRLASHPSPPAWQVILGIALTSASTIACVWAAGKIFRIGILSQGKTPSIREIFRWVVNP